MPARSWLRGSLSPDGPSPLARLGVAVLASAVALAVALALRPLMGAEGLFQVFVASVAVSAWFGGLRAGLLASVLCVAANAYFFLAPLQSLRVHAPADLLRLAIFAGVSGVVSWLSGRLLLLQRRERERADEVERQAVLLEEQAAELERQAEEAQELNLELEQQVEEAGTLRTQVESASDRLREASEAAREAEARLSAILETMAEGVALVDGEGRTTFANAALRALWPEGQVPPEAAELAARTLRAGAAVTGREMALGTAGGARVLRVSASPRRGPGGEGVVLSFNDVTERRRAEDALRETAERLRLAMESAEVGAWDLDPATGTLDWSERCRAIFGVAPGEPVSMEVFFQLTHPGDRDRVAGVVRDALDPGGDGAYVTEYRAVLPGGATRWIVARGRAFFEGEGAERRAVRFIGTVLDVTERRRAEETLRESEERFRTLADTAPVLVWMAGMDGLRNFFNKPWLDFTGRALEQELGSGWADAVHPDDLRRCLAVYHSSVEARRPFRMEYRLRRADGEYRWMLDSGLPRFTPDGEPAGFIGSCIDITERREGEEQLRFLAEAGTLLASSLDYEETLRRVARLAVPVLADYCVVDLLDERGGVRRVEAAHADAAMEPVVGELRRFPPDPDGMSVVAQVLRTGAPLVDNEVTSAKLARSARDGEHQRILERLGATAYLVVPLIASGRVLGAILLATTVSGRRYDESELVRAEELARRAAFAIENARLYATVVEANRAKSDFLAVMSHELRTPLNAIIGYADLFLLGIPVALPEAMVPQMERVKAAGRHLLELIDEILTFARLEAGQEEIRPERTDAAALVREAAALVEPMAIEKRLGFRLAAPEDLSLETDPRKARQVLVNLLGNAVKFTDRGQVWLEAEQVGGDVLFRVGDTGIGIDEKDRERIFDAFWQVEQTTIRKHGGSGLGLSVARQLARLMGGDITVESEPGRGSVFTVRLPVEPARGTVSAVI